MIKETIRNVIPPRLYHAACMAYLYLMWPIKGRMFPLSPTRKQQELVRYATTFNFDIFIETGTCFGNTVELMLPYFKHIHSIELNEELFSAAKVRFDGENKVSLYQGDSADILPKLVDTHKQDTILFWLDAHYSMGLTSRGNLDTPIKKEIDSILSVLPKDKIVVLIDDARLFNGKNDYPTLDELRKIVQSYDDTLTVTVKNDIIRISYTLLG